MKLTVRDFLKNMGKKDLNNLKTIKEVSQQDLIDAVDAFREGDIYKLSQTHSRLNGVHWYEFLANTMVISNVTPIVSNTLNLILRAIDGLVFENVVYENDDSIQLDDLRNILKDLISYGKMTVVFDVVDNKWSYQVIKGDENYNFNNKTKEDEFYFYEVYEGLHPEGDLHLYRYFNGLTEEKVLRLHDGTELILSDYFPELSPITKHKFKLYHHLSYEFNATKILGYLNKIDSAETQIGYINDNNVPLIIDPVLLRVKPGDTNPDLTTLKGTQAGKYNGAIKPALIENEDGTEQVIEPTIINPNIGIQTYLDAIDFNVRSVVRYFGLVPASVGYDSVGSNISGEALLQITKMSEQTKKALRSIIIKLLQDINMGMEISWDDPTDMIEESLRAHFRWMYENNLLSSDEMKRVSMPDKSEKEWNKNDLELQKDRFNGKLRTVTK